MKKILISIFLILSLVNPAFADTQASQKMKLIPSGASLSTVESILGTKGRLQKKIVVQTYRWLLPKAGLIDADVDSSGKIVAYFSAGDMPLLLKEDKNRNLNAYRRIL